MTKDWDQPRPLTDANRWLADIAGVRGFLYIGTPYTNYRFGLDRAYINALAVTGILTRHHLECYSPIVHCHPLAKAAGIDPKDGRLWMRRTASVRRAAGGLVVVEMEGWQESSGLTAEREEFGRDGKPIYNLNRVVLAGLIRLAEAAAK